MEDNIDTKRTGVSLEWEEEQQKDQQDKYKLTTNVMMEGLGKDC